MLGAKPPQEVPKDKLTLKILDTGGGGKVNYPQADTLATKSEDPTTKKRGQLAGLFDLLDLSRGQAEELKSTIGKEAYGFVYLRDGTREPLKPYIPELENRLGRIFGEPVTIIGGSGHLKLVSDHGLSIVGEVPMESGNPRHGTRYVAVVFDSS